LNCKLKLWLLFPDTLKNHAITSHIIYFYILQVTENTKAANGKHMLNMYMCSNVFRFWEKIYVFYKKDLENFDLIFFFRLPVKS